MIVNQFDVFLLDLDGVVYLGDEALPDAAESVNRLYEMNKEARFLTNDPRPKRQTIASNLRNLGIDAGEDEIITSGWATAHYLSQQGVTTAAVVGSEELQTELQEAGIEITEDNPEAMVVGADRHTSYQDIQRAARHIHRGATFVGTNPDGSFPTPEGPSPGAGAIVQAVEAAAGTTPTIVGKPEPLMFEMALDELADDVQPVVIGDNPATDVLGAHRAGLTGILVAEDEPSAESARDFQQPDATISTLAELFTEPFNTWESPPYSWPDGIHPGVGAVVLNDSDEVLLVKRADRGQWALPTGSVEQCEPVREAIAREVEEETGLRITVEQLTGIYSHPKQQVFAYPSGKAVHFITNCFRCTLEGGTPEAGGDEALEVGFFDVNDLPRKILSMQPQWIADATDVSDAPAIR
ncbi:HAD-IIA family hydrolase [Haloarcula sp. CBA1130]|uniref:HAD-IIA family hydrolase n=1 Tax=unclassified Haloarcula TaxID=2624677 RepID=UPI00124728CF|nr:MULTISPECIES: HAD-IIA family hydrolase [unclassified Haloarcula]KAA9396654.1 HAD-IIA family hydrolase [Haloarcula sp. CBA1130]KAA9397722.1 HAD-IIA family hydrolase [Haloarcula sp. CBA1129]